MPVAFEQMRALVVLNRGSRFVEAKLQFTDASLIASNVHNAFIVKSFPYGSVRHASLSRSHVPRGAGGVAVPLPLPAGRGDETQPKRPFRVWLTLETDTDRLVLWLEPQVVRPVLDQLRQRLKVVLLERFEGDPVKP